MNKNAMGLEQVFVFIIVAITFALITIFGYKAIADFLAQGEQVQFVQFKNELEIAVKRIYTQYGTVQIEEFTLPSRYQQICFVEMSYPATEEEITDLCAENPLACVVWKQAQEAERAAPGSGYRSVDENVFLRPPGPVPIKLSQFRLDQDGSTGFLCEEITKGQFLLRLEGKGSYTQLSSATDLTS